MRVAFIIDQVFSERGGTENQIIKLINGLGPSHAIDLICFHDTEWLRTAAKELPCATHVFCIDGAWSLQSYRNIAKLTRHLANSRPDVVQTFFPVGNIVGVLAARAAGIRNIVASRRDYGEWMKWHYLAATRFANLFVSRIACNSVPVKRLTEQIEGFSCDRIEVIHNGISVDAFRRSTPSAQTKQDLGIAPDSKVVGLVANHRPMKRHVTLLLAAKEVLQTRSDVAFLLIGGDAMPGTRRQATQQFAEALGIARSVHFTLARDLTHLRHLYSIMDVGVNCSESEGLSNAIMEYMASGIPCVVSESGGNQDLITDDVTGFTFPLDDHHGLAQKLVRMIDEGATRDRLSQAAYDKVRSTMSLEAMINRYARLFQELAGESSPATSTSA